MLEAIREWLSGWSWEMFVYAVGRTVVFCGAWLLAAKLVTKALDATLMLLGKVVRETVWCVGYALYRKSRYLDHLVDVIESSGSNRTPGWYGRAARAILGLRRAD